MASATISGTQAWLLAARLKTLPAAVVPVLVGTAVAASSNEFALLPALAAMMGALLIQVGTAEALLDDATRVAEKASTAGVDVTLEPWDDMIHVWQIFASQLPEAREAIDRIGDFIRKRIA